MTIYNQAQAEAALRRIEEIRVEAEAILQRIKTQHRPKLPWWKKLLP